MPSLGAWIAGIEHVGSTAVPHLDGKPVIDVLIGVRNLQDADAHVVPGLQRLEYTYVRQYEDRMPYRRFLIREHAGTRTHQIHLVEKGTPFWQEHVLFRDYLRAHPAVANAYAALKYTLAQRLDDANRYAEAKTDFIQPCMQAARLWRVSTAPQLRSPRLQLRPWQANDVESLFALNANPRVMEWMYVPAVWTRQTAADNMARLQQHMLKHGFGLWAVQTHDDSSAQGWVGLNVPKYNAPFMTAVEVAWRLHPHVWERGFATEAAQAALQFAFEPLGLMEVIALTVPQNQRSRRVMEKLGMQHNPDDDFEHPLLPAGHRLRQHVLYRLAARDPS